MLKGLFERFRATENCKTLVSVNRNETNVALNGETNVWKCIFYYCLCGRDINSIFICLYVYLSASVLFNQMYDIYFYGVEYMGYMEQREEYVN